MEFVDPEQICLHPTSQWFLSDFAFSRFIPAILLATCLHSKLSNEYPSERLVFDHFETNWRKRRESLVHLLSVEQTEFVDHFDDNC